MRHLWCLVMKGSIISVGSGTEIGAGLNMTTTGIATGIAISVKSTTTEDATATVITTGIAITTVSAHDLWPSYRRLSPIRMPSISSNRSNCLIGTFKGAVSAKYPMFSWVTTTTEVSVDDPIGIESRTPQVRAPLCLA
jgi:hypothetical protein